MKTLNQRGYGIIFSKASQMLTKLTIPFSIDDINIVGA
jgi:hypothetical protein